MIKITISKGFLERTERKKANTIGWIQFGEDIYKKKRDNLMTMTGLIIKCA